MRTRTVGGATTTYEYDALGALRSVSLPTAMIDYVVDGRGRRVGKKVNGQLVQQWIYGHGLSPLAELDGAGVVKKRFVYGSRPNVPDMIKTYPDGKVYRVFSDQLGSPRMLYDVASSTVAKTMEFDEFGIRLDTPGGLEIPFGFAGGLYDIDTKLTRFGVRDYDASIGRWVSKDPSLFRGGINLYLYANDDPSNYVDPDGRNPLAIAAVILIGVSISGDSFTEGSGSPQLFSLGLICLGSAGFIKPTPGVSMFRPIPVIGNSPAYVALAARTGGAAYVAAAEYSGADNVNFLRYYMDAGSAFRLATPVAEVARTAAVEYEFLILGGWRPDVTGQWLLPPF